jgi:16S rRNA (guanine527-N7)-methyltransferase
VEKVNSEQRQIFDRRIPVYLELGFGSRSLEQLQSYIELLWESNEELNLISRKMTFEDLIDNHVIDCLLTLKFFPADTAKVVADFGAGGGLPSVVYAIQFPHIQFLLFEKSPKKQDFLKRCQKIASNLQIHGDIPKRLTSVDLVMARAFKPLDVILDMSREYYKEQGSYFLLKGRREKIDEEFALAKKKFKDLEIQVQELKSPVLEVERHLVQIHLAK